jgi:Domain of unknown function (DUF397)
MTTTLWTKAHKSGTNGGSCVEVGRDRGMIAVRDTKDNGRGPVLYFTEPEFDAFLDGARKGEFDHLLNS